jgi:hypothetical protein
MELVVEDLCPVTPQDALGVEIRHVVDGVPA